MYVVLGFVTGRCSAAIDNSGSSLDPLTRPENSPLE